MPCPQALGGAVTNVTNTIETGATAEGSAEGKLPLGALIALVVGSMIGGGIFALPSQMAAAAAPGPLIIGWLITGIGMLALAFAFQALSRRRHEIDGGVYGYARAGFGNYIGFTSAWGYWLSAWIGNIGYLVLLFSTLGYFFPAFKSDQNLLVDGGANILVIIGSSVLIWVLHFLLLAGVREAAFINTVVTIAKVVPILTFIVLVGLAFNAGVFSQDFWGETTLFEGETLGGAFDQVKNMMLITVWVFIGIEGASVYSSRAKKRSDVGKATVIGFVGVLALLVAVNLFSFAVMQRPEIAALEDPSMAGVLAHVVGPWGAAFVAIGLIVSLLGAILAWVLLCAEIFREPSNEAILPTWVGRLNSKGTPSGALWLTTIAMQILLIWTIFNGSGYTALIILASSLILLPYFWSALFQLINAIKGEGYEGGKGRASDILVGVIATVYGLWLVYAGGLGYLLIAAIFYLVGTPLYIWARKEAKAKVFSTVDLIVMIIVVLASIAGIILLAMGVITV